MQIIEPVNISYDPTNNISLYLFIYPPPPLHSENIKKHLVFWYFKKVQKETSKI